jgi:hypothetical protein
MIAITDLPLRDYPLLVKFKKLKSIQYYKEHRSGATDEKLEALAALTFPQLHDIELVAAKSVTDKGIRALSKMKSLTGLSLEGTSITDDACEIIVSKMHLDGVNVANCGGVTLKGLLSLSKSECLKDISFSADQLTQEEVVRVIKAFKGITWCQIVDPNDKLDKEAIDNLAKAKGITVVIKKQERFRICEECNKCDR